MLPKTQRVDTVNSLYTTGVQKEKGYRLNFQKVFACHFKRSACHKYLSKRYLLILKLQQMIDGVCVKKHSDVQIYMTD